MRITERGDGQEEYFWGRLDVKKGLELDFREAGGYSSACFGNRENNKLRFMST